MVNEFRRLWVALACLILLGVASSRAQAAEDRQNAPAGAAESEATESQLGMPSGDGLSKWKIDDADPMKSVPTPQQRDSDPLQFGYHLMDLTEKGGVAARRGDHSAAARYFAALAKAVPDRSIAFSKACASYEAIGEWEKAIEYCRTALGRPGVTVADSVHFVRLALAKRTALDKNEIEDVSTVVENLKREPNTQAVAAELECELGTRIEDVARLDRCTTDLARTAPGAPKTISYQFALALKRRDYDRAEQLVERAKGSGIGPEGILRMEKATEDVKPLWRRVTADWRVGTVAALLLVTAAALLSVRRRGVMRATAS